MEEDIVKCECCDELFSRGAYDNHWAQHFAWRDTPLWALFDLNWAHRFKQGGYTTVGSVYDATPEALAKNVMGVGPKRAVRMRQIVVNHVKGKIEPPAIRFRYAEIDEPTPEFWDAVKTVASLLAIGVLGTLTIWWLS